MDEELLEHICPSDLVNNCLDLGLSCDDCTEHLKDAIIKHDNKIRAIERSKICSKILYYINTRIYAHEDLVDFIKQIEENTNE